MQNSRINPNTGENVSKILITFLKKSLRCLLSQYAKDYTHYSCYKSTPKPWPAGNNIIWTNETNSAVAEHLMLSKTGVHGGTGIWKMQNSKISLLLLLLSYPRNVYWAPNRHCIYSDEQNRHGPLLLSKINMKPITNNYAGI